MNSYNLEGIQEVLNKIHPKQIINRVGNLKFSLFEVKYQYTTNRNNRKEGTKYFLIVVSLIINLLPPINSQ